MQLFGPKTYVGLDIGSNCIKVVQITKKKKKYALDKIGILQTPENSFANGEVINMEEVVEQIKKLFDKFRINKKNVVVSMFGAQVISKRIVIPKMDLKLLPEQLKWEAEQYIPYELDEVNIDYNVLKKCEDPESMAVFIVAALREGITKNIEMAQETKLNLAGIDVSSVALFNVFNANYDYNDSDRIVLFSIGAEFTQFVVVENKEIVFCRDIPVGGRSYTQEIENALGISYEEAEALKISASNGEEVPEEVMNTINMAHEFFCEEINTTIEYYLNTTESSGFSASYVTGGGLKVFGLYEKMVKTYRVKRLDPFLKLNINTSGKSESMVNNALDFAAVSIGLAVGMMK